jgi:hypothetical protein
MGPKAELSACEALPAPEIADGSACTIYEP